MNTSNNTDHAWRKYFYSGVGFVAHSRDIMQRSVDQVVKHGSVNEAEGKKIVESAMQKLETGYNEAVHKLSALSSAEISKLKGRIAKLERQLVVKTKTVKPAKASRTKKRAGAMKATH